MRAPILIDDPDDPRVADYIGVRERDLVGRDGRFIAEGEVVIDVALARGAFPLRSVLVARPKAAGLAGLLDRVPATVPVYAAEPRVMDAVTGFHIHRGLLAVGARGPERDAGALLDGLSDHAVVIGLVGITNHDNVGGIFRNAAAFGADAVLVDGATCDPLYRKAIRVSVGARIILNIARVADPGAMLDMLERRGFEAIALSPGGAQSVAEMVAPRRAALLLGAEGPGLPDHVLARAQGVRIDMAPGFDSLNVATASGIALHRIVPF